MLGYEDEHLALLEAVTRELGAVEAQLTAGILDAQGSETRLLAVARSQVAKAFRAVQGAAATAVDASWIEGDSRADFGDLETLREASTLRCSALRSRDLAEAQLSMLRSERAELLSRLQSLAEEEGIANEEQQASALAEIERERRLEAQCEELERKTQNLRNEVLSKGRRLDARNVLGAFIVQQHFGAARRQAKAEEEASGAKQILELKRVTDAHLKRVEDERNEVLKTYAEEKAKLEDRAKMLQNEWGERRSRHHEEVVELEREIAGVEGGFEERWNDGEEQLRFLLEEQNLRARQAIQKLELEMSAQNEILRNHAVVLEDAASAQQLDLAEVGRAAEDKMEAQLEAKRLEIEMTAEVERQRCSKIRRKNLLKVDVLAEEAQMFQQGIKFLRESYSGFERETPQRPLPRPPKVPRSVSPYSAHAQKLAREAEEGTVPEFGVSQS